MAKILIVGLVDGEPTPFDGQWLAEYDPTRRGVDPHGLPLIAHLVTTKDVQQAKEFASWSEAEECWKQSFGTRKNGQPNRPLTAFIIEIRQSKNPPEVKRVARRALVTFVSEIKAA